MDTPDFGFLEIADVTGDGNPDIVGVGMRFNPISTEVSVLVGDGAGGFAPPVMSSLDEMSSFLLSSTSPLTDYDGDGRSDICLVVFFEADETMSIDLVIGYGQEDGTMEFTIDQPLEDYLSRTVVVGGDFNGDACPDIAVLHSVEGEWIRNREMADQLSGLVSIHYNNGAGLFKK
jgi:hypothetical protein